MQVNDDPLSDLEIKHGIDHVVEALSFLHGSCKLVHCSLSPMSIVIAADGKWKLSGLGLSQPLSPPGAPCSSTAPTVWPLQALRHLTQVSCRPESTQYHDSSIPCAQPITAIVHAPPVIADEFMGLSSASKQTYCYDYDAASLVDKMARPDLQFTAPELISSVSEAPVSGAADVFSLACVIYRVLRKQSLFTAQTTPEYRSMMSSMHLIPVDGLPPTLQVGHLGLCRSSRRFDSCNLCFFQLGYSQLASHEYDIIVWPAWHVRPEGFSLLLHGDMNTRATGLCSVAGLHGRL